MNKKGRARFLNRELKQATILDNNVVTPPSRLGGGSFQYIWMNSLKKYKRLATCVAQSSMDAQSWLR